MEAAQRELAGAEAGDGRDESNRSLSERLRDAENAQVGFTCIHSSFRVALENVYHLGTLRSVAALSTGKTASAKLGDLLRQHLSSLTALHLS